MNTLSAVLLFATTVKCVVRHTEDTQCIAGLSCDKKDGKLHTPEIMRHVLNPQLMHGNSHYIIVVEANQTAACFNSWSSVFVCHEV
jgi:hypothetical protein